MKRFFKKANNNDELINQLDEIIQNNDNPESENNNNSIENDDYINNKHMENMVGDNKEILLYSLIFIIAIIITVFLSVKLNL